MTREVFDALLETFGFVGLPSLLAESVASVRVEEEGGRVMTMEPNGAEFGGCAEKACHGDW